MKKLILTLALAFTTQIAMAGDDVIPLGRGGYGVIRGGGNMYRPIPKGTSGVSGNRRTLYAKPTQHYYTRDKVVSYRYVEEVTYAGGAGVTYNGPRAAMFVPGDDYSSRNHSIRSFAAVTPGKKPGVPMVPKRGTVATTTIKSSVASR